jgi:hypothetical protein
MGDFLRCPPVAVVVGHTIRSEHLHGIGCLVSEMESKVVKKVVIHYCAV